MGGVQVIPSSFTFRFSVNSTGKNKDWDYKKLAKNFRDRAGTIEDVIAHVKQGHALCAGNLNSRWRSKSNVTGSQWILLDIDNSGRDESGNKCYSQQLTLDEALEHPFIKKYCALIYTTASHKTDWHKFRLVFLLPEFVAGSETVEVLTRFLMKHLPHDPACKDASRVFYGNSEAEFPLIQANVTLPDLWVQEAVTTARQEKWEYEKRVALIEKRQQEFRTHAKTEGWKLDELIQQALSFIPPRSPGSGNYDECLKVLMALNDYYGAVEGQAIAEGWSPSIKGTTWNVGVKFKSFRGRNGISIGTLFHIAKQYGFKFPKGEQNSFESRAINRDGVLEKTVTRKQWKSAKNFQEIQEQIPKLEASLGKRKQPWGFGKKQNKQLKQEVEAESTDCFVYEVGDRYSTWANVPHQFVVDSSGTGSGKSYDAGTLQPSDFDCEKVFYISNDSRNPTTPTLKKGWAHLEGRHNGLVRDDNKKLRRRKEGESYVVAPNCARTETINVLKQANVQAAYSANVACLNCSYLEACRGGYLFGYLGSRRTSLSYSRIITHPQSLPSSGGEEQAFDYSNSLLVLEEWSQVLKTFETVEVSTKDVDMLISVLATENLELLQKLLPLLTTIKGLFAKTYKAPSRFGWNYHQLKELLPAPEDIDLATLAEITLPDLSLLNPTKEYGEDIANLPANLRKQFQKKDSQSAQSLKESVLKQWILQLIEILQGTQLGYISADFTKLSITIPDTRLIEILQSAKKVICLDATGRVEELTQILGVSSEDIFSCKQNDTTEVSNLEVIQVAGLGRMGISRGADQQKRSKAIIEELTSECERNNQSSAVISYKKFDSKYQWFVDSRGVNDLESVETIILDGIPTPNLEAMKAEFSCIYSRVPKTGTQLVKQPIKLNTLLDAELEPYFEYEVSSDSEFAAFIRHRILETINQAIGRNRSLRYPNKQFKVYVLGDYPLDMPVTLIEAANITPEAATKVERAKMAIKQAVQQLKEEGTKITQTAIAKLANLSQQRISQLKEFLLILLKDTNTKTSRNNNQSKPPPEDALWAANTYLPLIATQSDSELLDGIALLLEGYSLLDLLAIWNLADFGTQINVLSSLFGLVPQLLINSS